MAEFVAAVTTPDQAAYVAVGFCSCFENLGLSASRVVFPVKLLLQALVDFRGRSRSRRWSADSHQAPSRPLKAPPAPAELNPRSRALLVGEG